MTQVFITVLVKQSKNVYKYKSNETYLQIYVLIDFNNLLLMWL